MNRKGIVGVGWETVILYLIGILVICAFGYIIVKRVLGVL